MLRGARGKRDPTQFEEGKCGLIEQEDIPETLLEDREAVLHRHGPKLLQHIYTERIRSSGVDAGFAETNTDEGVLLRGDLFRELPELRGQLRLH